jgi:hypothetical protein
MAESAKSEKAVQSELAEAQADDSKVTVELNPDFKADGEVTVSVGSFKPVKLSKDKTAKVSVEHARVLQSTPFARVAR